jgi:hypothetical protein
MKKRLHDKKAGIAILIALILVILGDMIFRAVALDEAILVTPNLGEPVIIICVALGIIALALTGKDRACYIIYGAWIAYFMFDQLLDLPSVIINMVAHIHYATGNGLIIVAMLLRIFSMVCIIAIGALLVEYMIDGTIYNKAFNALCFATILMLVAYACIAIVGVVISGDNSYWLAVFNILYYITMVFLFTFFAYDSAKHQLKKTKFDN